MLLPLILNNWETPPITAPSVPAIFYTTIVQNKVTSTAMSTNLVTDSDITANYSGKTFITTTLNIPLKLVFSKNQPSLIDGNI